MRKGLEIRWLDTDCTDGHGWRSRDTNCTDEHESGKPVTTPHPPFHLRQSYGGQVGHPLPSSEEGRGMG